MNALLTCCLVVVFWLLASLPAHADERRFTDVTAETGIKIADDTGVGGTNPHAVAIEDFNEDGLSDIIIPTFGAPFIRYFQNTGGLKFKDVTKGSGLEGFQGDGTGAAVADYDRDGHLDVYITSLREGACRLYKGKGDGTFRDVSQAAGVLLTAAARSCAWSDIDQDGWVDLCITGPKGPNWLFKNGGEGRFQNIAHDGGVELPERHSLACAFGDVDGDGRDDLFVTSYESQASALLKNLGDGKFRDITADAGLARKASSVGGVLADVFNRGRLDVYVTTDSWLSGANYTEAELREQGHSVEPNVLYVGDGAGRFQINEDEALAHKTLSHDAVLEDLDHDGQVEIYVGVDAIPTGNRYATSKGGNPLWTRDESGKWLNAARHWGVDFEANCVCVPAVDFDNDGDLDLLLINFYDNVVLYRNNTNDQRWLRVKAIGKRSNPDGIGSKIALYERTGDTRKLLATRHVQSGAGYCRSSPLEVHFGLGSKAARLELEVQFPGNSKSTIEIVEPGQRVEIREVD